LKVGASRPGITYAEALERACYRWIRPCIFITGDALLDEEGKVQNRIVVIEPPKINLNEEFFLESASGRIVDLTTHGA